MQENALREKLRSLEAAYSVAGREALAKMSAIEVYLLHTEKIVDLHNAQERLKAYPHDELGQLRREKAAREASDIAGYIKEQQQDRESRGMER